MSNEFGDLIRKFRKDSNKSLRSVARHLGISAAYLSDVEKGRRSPLTGNLLRDIGNHLEIPIEELALSIARTNGKIKLDIANAGDIKCNLAFFLRDNFHKISDNKAEQIKKYLKEKVMGLNTGVVSEKTTKKTNKDLNGKSVEKSVKGFSKIVDIVKVPDDNTKVNNVVVGSDDKLQFTEEAFSLFQRKDRRIRNIKNKRKRVGKHNVSLQQSLIKRNVKIQMLEAQIKILEGNIRLKDLELQNNRLQIKRLTKNIVRTRDIERYRSNLAINNLLDLSPNTKG